MLHKYLIIQYPQQVLCQSLDKPFFCPCNAFVHEKGARFLN